MTERVKLIQVQYLGASSKTEQIPMSLTNIRQLAAENLY